MWKEKGPSVTTNGIFQCHKFLDFLKSRSIFKESIFDTNHINWDPMFHLSTRHSPPKGRHKLIPPSVKVHISNINPSNFTILFCPRKTRHTTKKNSTLAKAKKIKEVILQATARIRLQVKQATAQFSKEHRGLKGCYPLSTFNSTPTSPSYMGK